MSDDARMRAHRGALTHYKADAVGSLGRPCDRHESFVEVGALLAAGGAAVTALADRAAEDAAALGRRGELALRHDALGDAVALPLGAGAGTVLLAVAGSRIPGAVALPADAARDHLRRLAARGAGRETADLRDAGAGNRSAGALAVGAGRAGAQLAELLGDAADVGGMIGPVARAGGIELGLGGLLGGIAVDLGRPSAGGPRGQHGHSEGDGGDDTQGLRHWWILRRDWQRPLSYVAPSRASGFAGSRGGVRRHGDNEVPHS